MSVQSFRTVWVGWPGVHAPPGPDRDALAAALRAEGYAAVHLDPRTVDLHYNGEMIDFFVFFFRICVPFLFL
jgi:hypothetical protein